MILPSELKDANFEPEYNVEKEYDDNLEKSEIISGKQENAHLSLRREYWHVLPSNEPLNSTEHGGNRTPNDRDQTRTCLVLADGKNIQGLAGTDDQRFL